MSTSRSTASERRIKKEKENRDSTTELIHVFMTELLYKDEVHRIVGCSMEVLNTIGHGFHEKIYENALVVEFGVQQIPAVQQPEFSIIYKTVNCGSYVPDLICFDAIVVDTKTIEQITNHELGKMLNYLKITDKKVGLLINFKHAKLEWKRVVLESAR